MLYLFLSSFFAILNGLTTEQQNMLDWHNTLRQETANGQVPCYGANCPRGTVPNLQWDDDLAALAENTASNLAVCGGGLNHTTNAEKSTFLCNRGTSNFQCDEWVGENLAYAGGGTPSGESTINGWGKKEALCFEWGNSNSRCSDTSIGHYTQAVAERSKYVGCGCSELVCPYEYNGNTYQLTFQWCSCNYAPGGNYGSGSSVPYTVTGSGGGGSSNTEEPTTEAPVTTKDTSGGSSGSACESLTISGIKFGSFNGNYGCQLDSSFSNVDLDKDQVYGPVSSYNVYFYYMSYWKRWFLHSNVGGTTYYGFCQCSNSKDCELTSCSAFYDWNDGYSSPYTITIQTTNSAYSSSSTTSDKDKNELIEGLLIGLGVAVGVFLICGLIFWLVKRKNSDKNKYNVVEMNNGSISNHEYVNMGN